MGAGLKRARAVAKATKKKRMADTFKAEHPPDTGWYFATNNPEDQTNQVIGYWDAESKTFATFDAELIPVIGIDGLRGVTIWHWEKREFSDRMGWRDRECDGLWRGPEQWYGPVEPVWFTGTEQAANA